MKTRCMEILFGSLLVLASQDASLGAEPNSVSDFIVAQRSAHENLWVKTATNDMGDTVTSTFTEIATGLNFWDEASGQWKESKEEIIAYPGGAAATNGQHKVIFANDLNTAGAIDLLTPDGKRLQSHILGLSYQDTVTGSNVLITELRSSVSGTIFPPNQVIYTNAFTDFSADVLYRYKRAGFEQLIILREAPPAPEEFGLSSQSSVLQVLTEFDSPPEPIVNNTSIQVDSKNTLNDQELSFGTMSMGDGKAFVVGNNQMTGVPVTKEWTTLEGRNFLVEQVQMAAIAEQLDSLPPHQASTRSGARSARRFASTKRVLPIRKLAKASKGEMQMAKLSLPSHGFVIDYDLTGNQTNFTFKGDTTYYVSGTVNLYGTSSFEGGAVIKYTNDASINFAAPQIIWSASAYRPILFTSKDDNSAGDTISGSTGNPTTNYYANPALSFGNASYPTLSNFRIAFAKQALVTQMAYPSFSIYHAQFANCQNGAKILYGSCTFRNVLFCNVLTNFNDISSDSIYAENATFDDSFYLATPTYSNIGVTTTNCVFANVTNLMSAYPSQLSGDHNGFYNTPSFGTSQFTNTADPFQKVGAGYHYLADISNNRNVATTNIDPTLLADLKTKTTYPPLVLSNITVSSDTVLSPQVQRDTDEPDLGYHYDPIDVIPSTFAITNATLNISPGTVLGFYQDSAGIWLQGSSSLVSSGTATAPVRLVRYNTVQEQQVQIGPYLTSGLMVSPYHTNVLLASANFRFSRFSSLGGGESHFYHANGNWAYTNLVVQDCESWSGKNYFGGTTNSTAVIRNTLFHRGSLNAFYYANSTNVTLAFSNNLVWNPNGNFQIVPGFSTNLWLFFNNVFDTCTFGAIGGQVVNDYNGYINCNKQLNPTNANNIVLTSFTYTKGPLGDYYQVSTNFLDKGSTTADVAGLYHYTVTTNLVSGLQIKETNSVVDIGYHYVAVTSGNVPIDTDNDGNPDYAEDVNGNGSTDSGETNWQSYNSPNGLVSGSGLQVFTPLK